MNPPSKGKSPFYPGQPVPVEFFAGRKAQIDHVVERGINQVSLGKPVSIFIQGEYGIGKSSIAGFLQLLAERDYGLYRIYAQLGSATSLEDVGVCILEATIRSGAFNPKQSEKIRGWLAKYIGKQSLFGLTIHGEALKNDAPSVANGLLPFFSEALDRLSDTGVKGIFLVLDEINGVSSNPKFAHVLKGLVDTNAVSRKPLPLLFMLCGVEERRREMIRHHQPIDRIFDVVGVEPMNTVEMEDFFARAFASVQTKVEPAAIRVMTEYSAGFPKIMHLVGDAAFWLDQDNVISQNDALNAVVVAAEEVGKKYVDQQVYRALRSRDYHSILGKIAKTGLDNNFLQRMKRLNVLRSGDVRGEYLFNVRMVRLYIWLDSLRKVRKDDE
jgi:hypothetical protein